MVHAYTLYWAACVLYLCTHGHAHIINFDHQSVTLYLAVHVCTRIRVRVVGKFHGGGILRVLLSLMSTCKSYLHKNFAACHIHLWVSESNSWNFIYEISSPINPWYIVQSAISYNTLYAKVNTLHCLCAYMYMYIHEPLGWVYRESSHGAKELFNQPTLALKVRHLLYMYMRGSVIGWICTCMCCLSMQ